MKLSLFVLSALSLLGAAFGCCVFNGQAYNEGEIIENSCIHMICKYDSKTKTYFWYTSNSIYKNCDSCRIWHDPHIVTFDADIKYLSYYWQGVCRYSLAQYVDDWTALPTSDVPAFAVYGSFKSCTDRGVGQGSCVDISSYQLSGSVHDVVHVEHSNVFRVLQFAPGPSPYFVSSSDPTQVEINGTPYQLLGWSYENCLRLLGPQFFIEICGRSIQIWTPLQYLHHLGGLCGNYTGEAYDDHTGSSNEFYPFLANPSKFPLTWRADIQFNEKCYDDVDTTPCPEELLTKYMEMCKDMLSECKVDDLSHQAFLDACAEDLCTLPDEVDKWLKLSLEYCERQAMLQSQTISDRD